MRVLVTGAGGYVGGRLVPVLLDRGHDVVASFSSGLPERRGRWWLDRVEVAVMDVLEEEQVRAALREVDAVVYLVHSLAGRDFAERDRRGAALLARVAADSGVQRIAYLSGLVPEVPEDDLSAHIASRLEVERILSSSGIPTVTLRAAIVVGSGSTSFELLRHASERLPVRALPPWTATRVQPVAVVDVLALLAGSLDGPAEAATYDVGGPEQLTYAELMKVYADVARLVRPQLPLLLPRPVAGSSAAVLAGELAGRLTGVPTATVTALLESLHHDMVCSARSSQQALLPADHRLLGVREAIERALTRPLAGVRAERRDPMGPMPWDPSWAGGSVYLFDGEARHCPRGTLSRVLLGVRRPW